MLGNLNLFCNFFILEVIIFKFLVIIGSVFNFFLIVLNKVLFGVVIYLLFLVVVLFWGII